MISMNIREVKDGAILEVYVKPKSRKFSIKIENNEIVIRCTEPPVKGKANREIEKELSKLFKAKAIIISGYTSSRKQILIYGLSSENIKHIILNLKRGK